METWLTADNTVPPATIMMIRTDNNRHRMAVRRLNLFTAVCNWIFPYTFGGNNLSEIS